MRGTATHENVQAAAGKLTEVAFLAPVVGTAHVVPIGLTPGPAVVPPPPVTAEPSKEPYWNSRRTVGVVIAGVGVVGLVLGGVFGAERGGDTTSAASDLKNVQATAGSAPAGSLCTNPPAAATAACTALTNDLNSNGSAALVEETLLVSGGVLLGLGLVTTFWPGPAPSPAARITPMTGPHLAGLSWTGSF
jgi:hypothetical protein